MILPEDPFLTRRHRAPGRRPLEFLLNPARFASGGGGGSDPYFANVVALLHFEGTNGSTTITDVTGKAWTVSGTAALSSTAKPFGATSLSCAGGASDFVTTVASSADFAFGTGDFTLECWAYSTAVGTYQALISPSSANNGEAMIKDATTYAYYRNGIRANTAAVSTSVWNHVAVTRASGVDRTFLNGVVSGTTFSPDAVNFATGKPQVGACFVGSGLGRFTGFIKEARITKGVARYTSTFTPPTGPFPNS